MTSSMREYEQRKRELLGQLEGSVLDIGAGRGRDLPLYPPGIAWTGLEPDARRRAELVRLTGRNGQQANVLDARAERIPLPDNSMDNVVASLVLCSVDDPERALAEVKRVLRPGGRLVFCEHVAAPRGTLVRRLQEWIRPFSRRFDHGCDPSRETWQYLRDAGFATLHMDWYVTPLRVPCIAGYATTA